MAGCADTEAWLSRGGGQADEPPPELVEHITGCAHCRGLLVLLFADLADAYLPADGAPADDPDEQIASFVDLQGTYGLATAARTLPQTWWGILLNPESAIVYQALLDAAALPALPWDSAPPPARSFRAEIQLAAAAIARLLTIEQRLGVAWGPAAEETVLAEGGDEQLEALVCLRHAHGSAPSLVVRTTPPASGDATLTTAEGQLRQPLDADGCAVFDDIGALLQPGAAGAVWTITIG